MGSETTENLPNRWAQEFRERLEYLSHSRLEEAREASPEEQFVHLLSVISEMQALFIQVAMQIQEYTWRKIMERRRLTMLRIQERRIAAFHAFNQIMLNLSLNFPPPVPPSHSFVEASSHNKRTKTRSGRRRPLKRLVARRRILFPDDDNVTQETSSHSSTKT
nr:PREDICTED: uncharacterized protein LOC109034427 [Bemisia tabaci]